MYVCLTFYKNRARTVRSKQPGLNLNNWLHMWVSAFSLLFSQLWRNNQNTGRIYSSIVSSKEIKRTKCFSFGWKPGIIAFIWNLREIWNLSERLQENPRFDESFNISKMLQTWWIQFDHKPFQPPTKFKAGYHKNMLIKMWGQGCWCHLKAVPPTLNSLSEDPK